MFWNRKRISGCVALISLILLSLPPSTAQAQPTKVRFSYLNVIDLLPLYIAEKKGYLKSEGLDVEWMTLTSGPAAVTAVVSGSADVGFSGVVALILARIQNNPLKFFAGLNFESAPDKMALSLVSRANSQVKTIGDLRGKVLGINAYATQCEILAHVQLASAGLTLRDVRVTTIPVPQAQAALESGNVDAVCTQDPFLTVTLQSGVGRIIGQGQVFDMSRPYFNAGIFANEKWLAVNQQTAIRFKRAMARGVEDLLKDPQEARKILAERLHLPKKVADEVRLVRYSPELTAKDVQPVIDTLVKTGMIKKRISPSEIIAELP